MPKKVYRSLFDSDDVFEVEELTDDPEISTDDIVEVNTKDADEDAPTLAKCWDAIKSLNAKMDAMMSGKKVKDGNEPAEEMKVTKVDPEIDNGKLVNAQDSEDEEVDKSEEDEEKKEDKEVKDSYSVFARAGKEKVVDTATATQLAFQSRYDKCGNK